MANLKTLYVSRNVLNGDDIKKWAIEQGFKTMLPVDKLHVTLCLSNVPVDWDQVPPEKNTLTVTGGVRTLTILGKLGQACVLKFTSLELTMRHYALLNAGASHDFASYIPHLSISYKGKPESAVEYTGKIMLGPEIYAEVNNEFNPDIPEVSLV